MNFVDPDADRSGDVPGARGYRGLRRAWDPDTRFYVATSGLTKNAILAVGGASVDAFAWRFKGVLRVTVIAKATFAFAADGPSARSS